MATRTDDSDARRAAPATSPFLLVPDVAARYQCSVWTIHERARLGQIPHRKLAGSSSPLLFVPADLDAYDDGAALDVQELPGGGRIVRPVGEHPEASSVEGTSLGTPQTGGYRT